MSRQHHLINALAAPSEMCENIREVYDPVTQLPASWISMEKYSEIVTAAGTGKPDTRSATTRGGPEGYGSDADTDDSGT